MVSGMDAPRIVRDVMTRSPAVLHVTHSIRAAQRLLTTK